jgi:hypothetical protein
MSPVTWSTASAPKLDQIFQKVNMNVASVSRFDRYTHGQ